MQRVSNNLAFFCLLILIFQVGSGQAQNLVPLTKDIQVDQEQTPGRSTIHPAIAVNNKNAVMIVWAKEEKPQILKVYGRIYTVTGVPVTSEFKIDQSMSEIASVSGRIDIASDNLGNFFVVWEDSRKKRDYQILGRVFSPDGKALSKEIELEKNAGDTSIARDPSLAINNINKAMVVWVQNNRQVTGRIFDMTTTGEPFPYTDEIHVDENINKIPSAQNPYITSAPTGEFLVTWIDNRRQIAILNQSTPLVYASQFTATGEALNTDFLVNENRPNEVEACSAPAAVVDSKNNMIFCWNDGRRYNRSAIKSIYSRTFDWNRKPLSGDSLINTCITDDRPSIVIDKNDNFTIVFSQNNLRATDPGARLDHIFARRYRMGYFPIGEMTQIDQGQTIDLNTQQDAAISNTGQLLTTWDKNIIIDTTANYVLGHIYFNIFGEMTIPAPTNLAAINFSTNYIVWNWRWIGPDAQNQFFYLKDENNKIVSPMLPANNFTWEEYNLLPNVRISRRVFATRNGYESEASNEIRIYTRAEIPTNLRLLDTTETTIQIAWDGDRASRFAIERAEEVNGQTGTWNYIVQWLNNFRQRDFLDTPLEPSTTYYYRLRAYNGDSVITLPTTPLKAVTKDIYMNPPEELTATSATDSVVNWQWKDAAANENAYLLLDENGNPKSPALSADTQSFSETGLRPNVLYQRRVVCLDKKGRHSDASNLAEMVTLASPPLAVQATEVTGMQVQITWGTENATAFLIQRGLTEIGPWQTLVDWSGKFNFTAFTDSNLTPATSYWYWILSYNQYGIPNWSNKPIQVVTAKFEAPGTFWGEALSTSEIAWHWQDNSSGEKGFYLLSAGKDTLSDLILPDVTTWTEKNLAANHSFVRTVLAVPQFGNNLFNSNPDRIFTLANPPSNLEIIDSTSTSVNFQWRGNGASRFMIERSSDTSTGTRNWEIIAGWEDAIVDSKYEDTGLSPDQPYSWRIRGYNGDQIATVASNEIKLVMPSSVLAPPTGLICKTVSVSRIDWFWEDNTDAEAAYRLKDENGQIVTPDLPPDTKMWSDTTLKANTLYIRQVFAVNRSGIESGGSNEAKIFTFAEVPDRLRAYREADKIFLNWSGKRSSYFGVERALDQESQPGAWQSISTVVDSSFTDSVATNKSYWYRIFARNGDKIPTAPCSAVFVPTGVIPLVMGDLNFNYGLDFGDLDRLIEIILAIGTAPDFREMKVANFYTQDPEIDINDIMALVDTLLISPGLFSTAGQASVPENSVCVVPTVLGTQLHLNWAPQFHSMALELSASASEYQDINAVFGPEAANLITATGFVKKKFRIIAAHFNSSGTSQPEAIQLHFQSNSNEEIRLKLDKILVFTADKKLILLEPEAAEINLHPAGSPTEFRLLQNYPNPFNGQTEIRFHSPAVPEKVSLVIYNLLGQEIKTLIGNEVLSGFQKIKWNGQNEQGIDVPSGIYLYTLSLGDQQVTRKLILIR